jgi:predicted nuclease with TOPRIM domain
MLHSPASPSAESGREKDRRHPSDHILKLVEKGGKAVLLCAKSREEALEWMESLQKARAAIMSSA